MKTVLAIQTCIFNWHLVSIYKVQVQLQFRVINYSDFTTTGLLDDFPIQQEDRLFCETIFF